MFIQINTLLNVCDNSGILKVKCIKLKLKNNNKKLNFFGKASIKKIKKNKYKIKKGTIYHILILKKNYTLIRYNGLRVKFDTNSCIILNLNITAVATRILGNMLKEVRIYGIKIFIFYKNII